MPAATPIARACRPLLVAIASALLTFALSTRINPPDQPEFFDDRPRPADHMIDDVTLDMTSAPAALESLRQAAPDHLAFDAGSLTARQSTPLDPPAAASRVRLRNVRLGSALAFILEQVPYETPIQTRFEPTRIVVGGPGTAPRELVVRRHDVRDIHFIRPPEPIFITQNDHPDTAESLAETLSSDVPYPPKGGPATFAWGGHLYVIGTVDIQRAAEQALAFFHPLAGSP
jgi:hypothetical protein